MNLNKSFLKIIIFLFLLIVLLFSIFYIQINKRENKLLNIVHESTSKLIEKNINTLITDKKNANTLLALTLSKDYKIIEALENKNFDLKELEILSQDLRKNTNYKNVWIQIDDKDNNIKYQSWNKDKIDLDKNKSEYEKQGIKSIINVNKYDLSFTSIVPIYKDHFFLGKLEISTKFNSICEILKEENLLCAVLVDKKYKDIIKKPFTNIFLNDYYIANKNIDKKVYNFLNTDKFEKILSINDYEILDNYFIKSYKLVDFGTILIFKDKNLINVKSIKSLKINAYILLFIIIIILICIVIIYFYKNYLKLTKDLNKELYINVNQLTYQKNKTQQLLDSQSNIIIITNGKEIIDANKQLLKFYKVFKTLKDFKKKYNCVCDTFVPFHDEKEYMLDIDYDGRNWAEHILHNPKKSFKAAIYDDKKQLRHFALKVSKNEFDDFMIVTLTDITFEIESKEKLRDFNDKLEELVNEKTIELKELNENLEKRVEEEIKISKEKDIMIFQQNKMTSISQLLHNIAHQWRQPLSVISSASSGMLIQKELNILDDEFFIKSCNMIVDRTTYLSNTLDDFTNFFSENQKLELKSLEKMIKQCVDYLNIMLREKAINVFINIEEDINIAVYENEFKQAILHILNNSITSLEKNEIGQDRIILISKKDDNLIIHDSGKGVDNSILDKIFDPYFTTEHQSLGTGMGLYIVREILFSHMNFDIKVKNDKFTFNNHTYTGFAFIIKIKD